jgi:hypothetical protein
MVWSEQMGCMDISFIGMDFCPDSEARIYIYGQPTSRKTYFDERHSDNMVHKFHKALNRLKLAGVKFTNLSENSLVKV